MKKFVGIAILTAIFLTSCKRDDEITAGQKEKPGQTQKPFSATPYSISYPMWVTSPILMPDNNPLTVEGITLGRKLFYDPILSQNGTMSCATCHDQAFGFTDHNKQFSDGLHGEKGKRNAPPIFNLGWYSNYGVVNHRFFWDGGAADLESQVYGPITNPIEMSENLTNVVSKLKSSSEYKGLFKKAFGTDSITSQLLAFAISQFERTIISGSSKYDEGVRSNFTNFTASERNGMDVFFNPQKGDCNHCHNMAAGFFTDFKFHNNGTQQIFTDSGLARLTRNAGDMGKFKTPSLRNLLFTTPYMHDGRFTTLEQVVDFYDTMAYQGSNVDPFITGDNHPTGLLLSTKDKSDLVAFLKTLTDSSFIINPFYAKP